MLGVTRRCRGRDPDDRAGIGASTLVYSVFHAALLVPLPYASADA